MFLFLSGNRLLEIQASGGHIVSMPWDVPGPICLMCSLFLDLLLVKHQLTCSSRHAVVPVAQMRKPGKLSTLILRFIVRSGLGTLPRKIPIPSSAPNDQ